MELQNRKQKDYVEHARNELNSSPTDFDVIKLFQY